MFLKRGLNDLVAGVLVLLLIITVSVFVFNWIRGETEDIMEKGTTLNERIQACGDIDFTVEDAYCSNDTIVIRMSNNRNIDFKDGFSLRLAYEENEGGNDVSTFAYGTELNAYESVEIKGFRQYDEGPLGKNYFKIKEVEVTPKITLSGDTVFCNDNKKILKAKNC